MTHLIKIVSSSIAAGESLRAFVVYTFGRIILTLDATEQLFLEMCIKVLKQ